ncbi:MAG: class I SAM-dependent RNA methyltransferase [Clostridia bacterium]|nr:class I SAM-dependent RNA methyltransferase [Clostridia bacterium]
MEKLTFSAPCLFGTEGVVANELRFMDIEGVRAETGRVLFEGDFSTLARANIRCRCAERIQILVGEFYAVTFEELFEQTHSLPWEEFIFTEEAFPVKGSCLDSKLMSVSDCQKIIKKAVAKRLGEKYKTDWVQESGAVHQIQFIVRKDKVSLMLDTSGAPLHKRGYRKEANDAPISETLAATMVELSRVRPNHFVTDPMCGSGTIIIEAAMKALNISPGINRSFSAEDWKCIPEAVFLKERQLARSIQRTDCDFYAVGSDIDTDALAIARRNAEAAGVSDYVEFVERDLYDFSSQRERGTLITNPPYGERMLSVKEAEELYRAMGRLFERKKGWSYAVITPDDDFEKCFGRRADKRRKLYNGMLQCQLYMYYT